MNTCQTCYWWECPPGYDRKGISDVRLQYKCLHDTPKATLIPAQSVGGPTVQAVSFWPTNEATGRCASWRSFDEWAGSGAGPALVSIPKKS